MQGEVNRLAKRTYFKLYFSFASWLVLDFSSDSAPDTTALARSKCASAGRGSEAEDEDCEPALTPTFAPGWEDEVAAEEEDDDDVEENDIFGAAMRNKGFRSPAVDEMRAVWNSPLPFLKLRCVEETRARGATKRWVEKTKAEVKVAVAVLNGAPNRRSIQPPTVLRKGAT